MGQTGGGSVAARDELSQRRGGIGRRDASRQRAHFAGKRKRDAVQQEFKQGGSDSIDLSIQAPGPVARRGIA